MKATHGATKNRLTNGSQTLARETAALARKFPYAEVFFSTYSGNPDEASEEQLTKKVLPNATHVGAIPTTSAEAIALSQRCRELGIIPSNMIIVTDEFNSRRTKDIYHLFFPDTKIGIVAIPISGTYDPESPIVNFRNMNRAILWETLIPLVPFWVMTHTGTLGKHLLVWMSNRIRQQAASF
jgi:hypothetical protein